MAEQGFLDPRESSSSLSRPRSFDSLLVFYLRATNYARASCVRLRLRLRCALVSMHLFFARSSRRLPAQAQAANAIHSPIVPEENQARNSEMSSGPNNRRGENERLKERTGRGSTRFTLAFRMIRFKERCASYARLYGFGVHVHVEVQRGGRTRLKCASSAE